MTARQRTAHNEPHRSKPASQASHFPVFPTLQWTGALLGEAEVLLAQPLQRLVLSDLHTRAHVAVSVHEESESARQMFAAGQKERFQQRRSEGFTSFLMDSITRPIRASNSENGSGSVLQVLQDTAPEDALVAEREQLLASLWGWKQNMDDTHRASRKVEINRSSCFKEPEGPKL